MPTTMSLTPFSLKAGRASRLSSTALSQQNTQPKCLKNSTTQRPFCQGKSSLLRHCEVSNVGWPVATEVSSASARRSKGLVPTLADAEADGSVTEPPKKAFTGMTSTATATANVSAKFLLVMVGFSGRSNRNGTGGARSTATPARYEIREYEKNEKNANE